MNEGSKINTFPIIIVIRHRVMTYTPTIHKVKGDGALGNSVLLSLKYIKSVTFNIYFKRFFETLKSNIKLFYSFENLVLPFC